MSGRATLQVLLSGTLPAPLLQVDLTVQPEGRRNLPFQARANLAGLCATTTPGPCGYPAGRPRDRHRRPTSPGRYGLDRSGTRAALGGGADHAGRGPEAAGSREPSHVCTRGCRNSLGPCRARSVCRALAAQLGLKTDLRLRKLGIEGTAEHLDGAINMTGQMVVAPSVQDVKHAIQHGDLMVLADALVLRIPTLQGQLPAREGPGSPSKAEFHASWRTLEPARLAKAPC